MDTPFFCTHCGSEHAEPAYAILGHVVPCLDCAILHEQLGRGFDRFVPGPFSAVDEAYSTVGQAFSTVGDACEVDEAFIAA